MAEAAVMLEGRPVRLRVEAPNLDWATLLLPKPLLRVAAEFRLAIDTDLRQWGGGVLGLSERLGGLECG